MLLLVLLLFLSVLLLAFIMISRIVIVIVVLLTLTSTLISLNVITSIYSDVLLLFVYIIIHCYISYSMILPLLPLGFL